MSGGDPSRRRHEGYQQLLLVCAALLGGFALPTWASRPVALLLYNLMPLLLLRTLGQPFGTVPFGPLPRRLYTGLGLATLVTSLLWTILPVASRSTGLPLLVLWSLFSGWSTVRLVRGLAEERRVTGQVLMGALAGYLLMGLSAALIFSALERVMPGSFRGPLPGEAAIGFLKLNTFAFVTLTTTGYGDVVPVSPQAQVASVVVSVAGNCYLAMVMALLVSRFTVQEQVEQQQVDQQERDPGRGRDDGRPG